NNRGRILRDCTFSPFVPIDEVLIGQGADDVGPAGQFMEASSTKNTARRNPVHDERSSELNVTHDRNRKRSPLEVEAIPCVAYRYNKVVANSTLSGAKTRILNSRSGCTTRFKKPVSNGKEILTEECETAGLVARPQCHPYLADHKSADDFNSCGLMLCVYDININEVDALQNDMIVYRHAKVNQERMDKLCGQMHTRLELRRMYSLTTKKNAKKWLPVKGSSRDRDHRDFSTLPHGSYKVMGWHQHMAILEGMWELGTYRRLTHMKPEDSQKIEDLAGDPVITTLETGINEQSSVPEHWKTVAEKHELIVVDKPFFGKADIYLDVGALVPDLPKQMRSHEELVTELPLIKDSNEDQAMLVTLPVGSVLVVKALGMEDDHMIETDYGQFSVEHQFADRGTRLKIIEHFTMHGTNYARVDVAYAADWHRFVTGPDDVAVDIPDGGITVKDYSTSRFADGSLVHLILGEDEVIYKVSGRKWTEFHQASPRIFGGVMR
ncbi:hypothetical protein CAPTEDRAFT_199393, partial [Capitella teleta]